MEINQPEPISESHDLSQFDCGDPALNNWLIRRALQNHKYGASKTQVITIDHSVVIGFYCLAAGSVPRNECSGSVRRNQPEPVPVIVLGRLAIDQRYHGQGLGVQLLKHAYEMSCLVSQTIGARALLVVAKNDSVASFYKKYGFVESPIPLRLMKKII